MFNVSYILQYWTGFLAVVKKLEICKAVLSDKYVFDPLTYIIWLCHSTNNHS